MAEPSVEGFLKMLSDSTGTGNPGCLCAFLSLQEKSQVGLPCKGSDLFPKYYEFHQIDFYLLKRMGGEEFGVSLNIDISITLGEIDWALNKGVGVEKGATFLCYYVENIFAFTISSDMEQLYRCCYCLQFADKDTEVPGCQAEPTLGASFSDTGVHVILSVHPFLPCVAVT